MFISFEGIDGCGKSTQVELLKQWYEQQGRSVLVLREPGATPLSEAIREVLLSNKLEINDVAELMLFCASRRQLVENVIKPALKFNTIVICDRFIDSSTAYQGYGRGVSLQTVHDCNRIATDGLEPDCTFLVDIDVDISKERLSKGQGTLDRMEKSGDEFFNKVRDGYLTLAKNEKRIKIVFGNRPISEIHHEIVKHLRNEY